jgi:hypothetical protein
LCELIKRAIHQAIRIRENSEESIGDRVVVGSPGRGRARVREARFLKGEVGFAEYDTGDEPLHACDNGLSCHIQFVLDDRVISPVRAPLFVDGEQLVPRKTIAGR